MDLNKPLLLVFLLGRWWYFPPPFHKVFTAFPVPMSGYTAKENHNSSAVYQDLHIYRHFLRIVKWKIIGLSTVYLRRKGFVIFFEMELIQSFFFYNNCTSAIFNSLFFIYPFIFFYLRYLWMLSSLLWH